MKHFIKSSLLLAAFAAALSFYIPAAARAETAPLMSAVTEDCAAKGNCELSDALRVGIWVTQWILGIVGSLALLMFIYGGFTWLISGGNSKKVEQGRAIVIGAVIGLALVFASYTIVSFSLEKLGYKNPLGGEWFKVSN